jgi:hypothetical protein
MRQAQRKELRAMATTTRAAHHVYQEFAGVPSAGSVYRCRDCSWSGDYMSSKTHELATRTLQHGAPLAVKVTVTVLVDRDGYNLEYNEDATIDNIKSDLEYRVREAAAASFRPFSWARVKDVEA